MEWGGGGEGWRGHVMHACGVHTHGGGRALDGASFAHRRPRAQRRSPDRAGEEHGGLGDEGHRRAQLRQPHLGCGAGHPAGGGGEFSEAASKRSPARALTPPPRPPLPSQVFTPSSSTRPESSSTRRKSALRMLDLPAPAARRRACAHVSVPSSAPLFTPLSLSRSRARPRPAPVRPTTPHDVPAGTANVRPLSTRGRPGR